MSWRTRYQACKQALFAPYAPHTLAVFRITVCAVSLLMMDVHSAPLFGGLSPALRVAPAGMGWVVAHLPEWAFGVLAARIAWALFMVGCALGLVGAGTRAALAVAAISGGWLLGLPQLYGAVLHGHHLIWFLALLAASPSGDALSVDALLRKPRIIAAPSPAYGVPLKIAWLLIGLIYFFPGYWKWKTSGLAWALSDNLVHQMQAKWLQHGFLAPCRIDRFGRLCRMLALLVMGFEVSVLFLLPFRRLRPWLAGAATLFHIATDVLMRIRFTSLFLCYVVLFDWSPRRQPESSCDLKRSLWPTALVGALLIAGVGTTGLWGLSSAWPFACYPKFAEIAAATMPNLTVERVARDGTSFVLSETELAKRLSSQRLWALKWSILGKRGEAQRRALADYSTLLAGASDGKRRAYQELLALDPDAPKRILSRDLLSEWEP